MTKNLTPRFSEPIAAALMGAGFFIFASVLAGGPFWRGLEEDLWRRFQGPAAEASGQVILIRGSGREGLSLVQRRELLAKDIAILAGAGARSIMLEAWLDESSQAESADLLSDLLDSTKSLPVKSANSVQATVASLKAQLNTDANLAAAIRSAGNVTLPVVAEPSPSGASATAQGSVWGKLNPYQVYIKGKGARKLEGTWRLVRAPLEIFREACLSLAPIPPPQQPAAEDAQEVQAIFQVRGHWVNGMGFEAARLGLDLSSKGLQFIWRDGLLASVEMRGVRYPVSSRGGIWLPPQRDRAQIQAVELAQLEGAPILKSIKGRNVFFQPWPGLLVGGQAFTQQHDLAAGILTKKVQVAAEGGQEIWIGIGLGLAAMAAMLWLPAAISAAVLMLLLAAITWYFFQGVAPLARPLGMMGSSILFASGLRLFFRERQNEERSFWFRGHVATSAQARWQKLLPAPLAMNSLHGCFVALRNQGFLPSTLWSAWADMQGVFCEILDNETAGFMIPLNSEDPIPLAAIQSLRMHCPGAMMSLSRGNLQFQAEKVLDHVRWSLAGSPKIEALAMLDAARPGFFVLSETEYGEIRQNVKIQLLGSLPGSKDPSAKRIFNIIEVF